MDEIRSDDQLLSLVLSEARSGLALVHFCRSSVRFRLKSYELAMSDVTAALDNHDISLTIEARGQCFLLLVSCLLELGRPREAFAACLMAEDKLRNLKASQSVSQSLVKLKGQAEVMMGGPDVVLKPIRQHTRRFEMSSMVPKRLSSDLHLFGCSSDGKDSNLLILLHGLGDTPQPYHQLGLRMKLPQTCMLALAGPLQIPLLDGGRAWFESFDDEFNLIKPARDEKRRTQGLERSASLLSGLIDNLTEKGGYQYKEIHLFGFSQGGSCALEVNRRFKGNKKLGGCISLSGPVLPEVMWKCSQDDQEPCGPVLITVGEMEGKEARAEIDQSVKWLRPQGNVRLHVVKDKGHSMVSSKAEMTTLMSFWGETLLQDLSNAQDGIFEVCSKA